ncbi:MAG: acetyltransferase [Bacteroidia bacterium]|nr:acetyltransferase [Bacteroidia bacterium]MCZ2249597.1 acetyltransferase [Bacteroidia bacterium]
MKNRKLIIFGTGDIAQIAKYYFDIDSDFEVCGFTVDKQYCASESYEGLPLVPFEGIETVYPPADYYLFVALSYAQMNKLREQKFNEAKGKGYRIASYISSKCSYLSQFKAGENAFIFEDNTIQPFVKIGDNVTLWSGNHIGHHSVIESHNFISSHVVISGHCTIESYCFLGVNSTLAHKVKIAKGTLLGAGVVISKDTEEDGVYVTNRPLKLDKKSFEIKL